MRCALVPVVYGIALCSVAQPALALLQSCSASATPITFGTYSPSSGSALGGTGTLTVTCSVTLLGLLEMWTISLSSGNSASYASRQMTYNGSNLLYNLYTTAGHNQIWGNGSAGTVVVSDSQLLVIGTSNYPYTVYGLVTAGQDLAPGTYADTLTVTVTY